MEAFLKANATEALKRAGRARPRVSQEFSKGDLVFVFRKPLPRRGEVPREKNRPVWCGPGTVIMCEGPNVWISMRGELWKCAREQVRLATDAESDAHGLLRDEFEELRHELTRRESKRGFKDISKLATPGDEEEIGGEEEERPSQRLRTGPAEGRDEGGPDEEQPENSSASSSSSSSSSIDPSLNEPEREISEEAAHENARPALDVEQRMQSVIDNDRLDGVPGRLRIGPEVGSYGPLRRRI